MKKYPLVSIIIANWNGGKIWDNCLKSLSKIKYPNWELIVVDNNSTDGSGDYSQDLKYKIKKTKLIKNKENLGFAPANNQGYEVSRGKYVLLLNNDTLVDSSLLNVLVNKMEKDLSVGVIQPKIKMMDNPSYLDNAGSFMTRTGFLQHWGFGEKDSKQFNKEKEVFSAKGACMFIRRKIIQKVGLFDPVFMSYMEDSDFCWKTWLIGYKVIYYPETYILHKVGMSSKRMNQIAINYHSFKNRIRSLVKNLNFFNLFILLVPHIVILIFIGCYYLFKFQFQKANMIFRAIIWNIIHLPSTLKERKKIQALRKQSDSQIFKMGMKRMSFKEMFSHFRKVESNYK